MHFVNYPYLYIFHKFKTKPNMILQEIKENSALKLNNWYRFLISCDSAFFSKKYFTKNIYIKKEQLIIR